MREHRSSVKGISGSKSKANEGASRSVRRSVSSSSSSSSSLPTEAGSDSDTDISFGNFFNAELHISSDYGESDDSDGQVGVFQHNEVGKNFASTVDSLPCHGLMLLLFETPSGFALYMFYGVSCYLDSALDNLWLDFADPFLASMVVRLKGFLSFEDKSSTINADGIDNQLVALINEWHRPGMTLCVGKPEYKAIIESVLKIPCLCCQAVLEIMWGIQQQMRILVPLELQSKLTKEDRLPTSQGLMKFLRNCGFDVKPEMVNDKIFITAFTLFRCDADDKRNLAILRDAGLYIRDISGIACEDWEILKLAIAVKVICRPKEELTDFHEVLAEDVLSKLKGDAPKYKGVAVKVNWLSTYIAVAFNHLLRIEKKEMLGSLVRKAKKAYEAEQAEVCQKVKLLGESQQIFGGAVRRSPRLKRKLYENSGEGTPYKRHKY